MAAPKARSRTSPAKGRPPASPSFVCPDCGFQAKHAMGLGRHRTTRHGAPSKRSQARSGSGRRPRQAAPTPPEPGLRDELAAVSAKLDEVLRRLQSLETAGGSRRGGLFRR